MILTFNDGEPVVIERPEGDALMIRLEFDFVYKRFQYRQGMKDTWHTIRQADGLLVFNGNPDPKMFQDVTIVNTFEAICASNYVLGCVKNQWYLLTPVMP